MTNFENLVELNKRLSPAPWRLVEYEGIDEGYDNYFVIEDARGTRVVEDGSGGGGDFPVAFSEELEDIVTLRNSLPELLEELENVKQSLNQYKKMYKETEKISRKNLQKAENNEKLCKQLTSFLSEEGEKCPLDIRWLKLEFKCGDLGYNCHKCWIKAAEKAILYRKIKGD